MIPSIETIINNLLDGIYSKAEALQWIMKHKELARNEGAEIDGLRDHFAAQALPFCLAEFGGNSDDQQEYHIAAYQIADKMIKQRAA